MDNLPQTQNLLQESCNRVLINLFFSSQTYNCQVLSEVSSSISSDFFLKNLAILISKERNNHIIYTAPFHLENTISSVWITQSTARSNLSTTKPTSPFSRPTTPNTNKQKKKKEPYNGEYHNSKEYSYWSRMETSFSGRKWKDRKRRRERHRWYAECGSEPRNRSGTLTSNPDRWNQCSAALLLLLSPEFSSESGSALSSDARTRWKTAERDRSEKLSAAESEPDWSPAKVRPLNNRARAKCLNLEQVKIESGVVYVYIEGRERSEWRRKRGSFGFVW